MKFSVVSLDPASDDVSLLEVVGSIAEVVSTPDEVPWVVVLVLVDAGAPVDVDADVGSTAGPHALSHVARAQPDVERTARTMSTTVRASPRAVKTKRRFTDSRAACPARRPAPRTRGLH